MSNIKHLCDVSDLKRVFHYDPATGILYRRWPSGLNKPCGTPAKAGHLSAKFNGYDIGVHRIAWALHYGAYPAIGIDHINGNSADNRICNLRLATTSQNAQNSKRQERNKIGVKNVLRVKCRQRWKWRVSFGIGNGRYYNVHFHCLGEAVKHAAQMRRNFYGEFARVS